MSPNFEPITVISDLLENKYIRRKRNTFNDISNWSLLNIEF